MNGPVDGEASQPSHAFLLSVLGPFELKSAESGASIAVTTAKMRALLVYLAVAPRGSEDRRRLAGMLWASRGEETARQNLRQMLSNFRRLNDGRLLTIDDNRVGLNLSLVRIDRAALMELAPDPDVETMSAIADLYRGDFATGLEVDEPEFDAWLQAERHRCRDKAVALLDQLVRSLAEIGRHDKALQRANRLLELDPLREETHRLVISQEVIVSGRASAMQRFESFRLLLRDELGVRPEAATLRLLDELRRPDSQEVVPPDVQKTSEETITQPQATATPVAPDLPARRLTLTALAALAAALLLAVIAMLPIGQRHFASAGSSSAVSYIDDNTGRASIAVLPFESDAGDAATKALARPYEVETRLGIARQYRMTLIELPENQPVNDPAATGRALRAQYVLKTRLTESPGGIVANVSLLDSATAISLATLSIPMTGPPFKFSRQIYRYMFAEIAANRAKVLSGRDSASPAALSWQGAVAEVRTRVGPNNPNNGIDLFERVLAREPDDFVAIMSLAGALQLKVSRDQTTDRNGDLDRADAVLLKARQLKPSSADVAFLEGMGKILRGRFAEAAPDFDRAVQLDNTHWLAALKSAHVMMFLGQLDEADQRMEAVMPNLLPDIGSPETAFIAGEIALSAGHIDRAISYLETAVNGNPTVSRIQALYAAALWMAGRPADAHAAAVLSQTLVPPFPLDRLDHRGANGVGPLYREARARQAAALRRALAATDTNIATMSPSMDH